MTEELLIRDFKGVWIPSEVWLDDELKKMEMLLYVEIDSLSSDKRGCYASNQHFAKFLGISTSRVSQLIKKLVEKKYITFKLFYKKGTKRVSKREIHPIKRYSVTNKNDQITLDNAGEVRYFKGIWIPKKLWFDANLTKIEMLLFVEIDSLTNNSVGCYASNQRFAKFMRMTSSRASQLITNLKEKKYIDIKLIHYPDNPKRVLKREITVVNKLSTPLNKFDDPTKYINPTYLENCKGREPGSENQLSINNTVGQPDCVIPYQEIINYLNSKTSKQFKSTTPSTRNFIDQRWTDGFRFDDFKKVIDNKLVDWLNDPTRNIYLRPQTLFGTKFESYLNEKTDIPVAKRTCRQPTVEVGTDWSAPEHQARIFTKDEERANQEWVKKALAEMRSKNSDGDEIKND